MRARMGPYMSGPFSESNSGASVWNIDVRPEVLHNNSFKCWFYLRVQVLTVYGQQQFTSQNKIGLVRRWGQADWTEPYQLDW